MPDRFDPASLQEPIVLAPLGGGPSTPALAAAVSEAGGLGILAGAYLTPGAFADQLATTLAASTHPVGVNLFVPAIDVDDVALPAYLARLQAEADRYGVALGEPREDDDGWDDKLAVVLEHRPAVATFTFGVPPAAAAQALHDAGIAVWSTATGPEEAAAAERAGADAVVVQGAEAGGHRATFADGTTGDIGLLALLQLCADATRLPLIATGGIATGTGVAAVLAAGAVAAALGTAFLRAPQAGTPAPFRDALTGDRPTAVTRAFSGRNARGIANRFLLEHSPAAPRAWPHVNRATAPVRAAARARGDAEALSLWAGQAYPLSRAEEDAGALVRRLGAEARAALAEAVRRLPAPPPAGGS